MKEWSKYYLKDKPFKEASHLAPEFIDDRLNGKIFSKFGMEKAYEGLLELINLRGNTCYIRSDDVSRGTGKSALMAAVYWHIRQSKEMSERFVPVWVSLRDFRTINQLMGRVVDTMVFAGLTDSIKQKIGKINYNNIYNFIKTKKPQCIPSEVSALDRILSLPNEMLAWKYVNIRRSYPTVGHVELFTDLMIMFSIADKRRVLIFIDQFEEYVEYQRGAKLDQLAQDMKDLHRSMAESGNLTFVFTMHPETQGRFEDVAKVIIKSYGEIADNAVTLSKLEPKHLVKIAEAYLSHYRTSDFQKKISDAFPFSDSVLEYVTKNSANNPRTMILIMSKLLEFARYHNLKEIDLKFVKDPATRARTGLIEPKSL